MTPSLPRTALALPCEGEPELFFPTEPSQLRQAQALCAACPMSGECLERAVALQVTHGVWGGRHFGRPLGRGG